MRLMFISCVTTINTINFDFEFSHTVNKGIEINYSETLRKNNVISEIYSMACNIWIILN